MKYVGGTRCVFGKHQIETGVITKLFDENGKFMFFVLEVTGDI